MQPQQQFTLLCRKLIWNTLEARQKSFTAIGFEPLTVGFVNQEFHHSATAAHHFYMPQRCWEHFRSRAKKFYRDWVRTLNRRIRKSGVPPLGHSSTSLLYDAKVLATLKFSSKAKKFYREGVRTTGMNHHSAIVAH